MPDGHAAPFRPFGAGRVGEMSGPGRLKAPGGVQEGAVLPGWGLPEAPRKRAAPFGTSAAGVETSAAPGNKKRRGNAPGVVLLSGLAIDAIP
jgi:hypothetical protein